LTNFSKNSFYLLPEPLRRGEFLTNYCKNAKESKQKQKSPYEKSHSLVTNSLFHTVGYKNHSVGYIFHSVGYKSRTVKQRI